MLTDTRPRYLYKLPSGDIVPVIRDHGDRPDAVIDFQATGGDIVKARLVRPVVQLPVVHLNGSGRQSLYRQYQDAYLALQEAWEALRYAAPHGRDYYPLGDGAYEAARQQHEARLERIQTVMQDVGTIVGSLET